MLTEILFYMFFYSFIAFACAIIGHTFSTILLYEPILNWYGRLIGKLPEWLANPLGMCSKCFTGQLSLWITVGLIISHNIDLLDMFMLPYTICLAIYLSTKF